MGIAATLIALRLRWDERYDVQWDGSQYTARRLAGPAELLTGETAHLITLAMENDCADRRA